jgi:outer membrane immunogenic protein
MTMSRLLRSTFAAAACVAAAAVPAASEGYSGPYIGAAFLYGLGQVDGEVNRISSAYTLSFQQKGQGFAFGTFAGYDWKAAPTVVVGLLGDIAVTKLGAREDDLTWVGSLRGRLGTLVTPETLLYGTAGIGFVTQKLSGRLGGYPYDVSEIKDGFVWGGGIESRRLWGEHPVRLGLEVLRYQFNAVTFEVPDRRASLENSSWTIGTRLAFELHRGEPAAQPMK